MIWETVIGLETHVELATKTKIFCGCTTAFGGPPNTHCCPVCTGMPGTLPVLNGRVLEFAVKAGLALNCQITRYSRFDRKNYFYPDLPKAYQISQLYLPIARDGAVSISTEAGDKTIRIHELHMEEDAGKLAHDPWIDQTRADYNRCGVPLIEIVTQPDFRTADEVIAYLEKLKETLQYLGVSDCKMQEGSLRCDVNLSVRPLGGGLGTRTEMKNLNSFKAIARAIGYEAKRQIELIEGGKRVVQETRRWDENKDATYAMRSKEDAQDYRYFPEPDLPPVELTALGAPPKQGANWIMGEVLGALSQRAMEPGDMPLTAPTLARLIALVEGGTLNRNTAVKVFEAVFDTDGDVDAYVREHGLEQVNDGGLVREACAKVLSAHPRSAADYQGGKEKAFGFLVGQVMRELKGRANPQAVNAALKELLGS